MELLLRRRPSMDGVTIGELFVNGARECFVLEDIVRTGPKVMHETAIPAGRYRVDITRSARFGRMLPILLDVPGFSGIRIHPGNSAEDSSGCLLVGQGTDGRLVTQSRLAMQALQPKIASAIAHGEEVWIEIVNAGAPQPMKA